MHIQVSIVVFGLLAGLAKPHPRIPGQDKKEQQAPAQPVRDLRWHGDFGQGFGRYKNVHCGANSTEPSACQPNCSGPRCRMSVPWTHPHRGADTLQINLLPGDNHPPDKPWGEGERNELVGPFYFEGDDVYYGWELWLPSKERLPDPGPFQGKTGDGLLFFQFHSVGECSAGGPNIGVGLSRTDVMPCPPRSPFPCGFQRGTQYQLALVGKSAYDYQDGERWWPPLGGGDPVVQRLGQATRYNLVLHVRWSSRRDVGLVELFVNHVLVYRQQRPTLYTWPSAACAADWYNPRTPGAAMPVYMKLGLYRGTPKAWAESLTLSRVRAGPTYADAADCGVLFPPPSYCRPGFMP